MVTRVKRMALVGTPESAPRYEVRVRGHRPGDIEYEIWQMPSAATPQITAATRIAGLRGRNLELVEHRVLKRLGSAGVKLGPSRRRENGRRSSLLEDDYAFPRRRPPVFPHLLRAVPTPPDGPGLLAGKPGTLAELRRELVNGNGLAAVPRVPDHAPDTDPRFVASHVVDAVGNRLARGIPGKIVSQ